MRRDEIGAGIRCQRDLQKVARVEAENWPPIGSDIADTGEAIGNAVDRGEVAILGHTPKSPAEARKFGVAMVFQEIMVADEATITENLFAGADGLWSRTRERIGYGGTPTFSGRTAWRAVVPAGKVAPEFREPMLHLCG